MTRTQIRGLLYQQNKTLSSWAVEKGYRPDTVSRVIARWAGRRDGAPRGQTRKILAALSKDLRIQIVPGVSGKEAA